MNTKMKFESMANALPFIGEIAECETIKTFRQRVKDEKNLRATDLMSEIKPIFLTEKRDAFFGLLAALSGKPVQEIADQDWEETKKMMESPILNDLYDFFIFAVRMAKIA